MVFIMEVSVRGIMTPKSHVKNILGGHYTMVNNSYDT